MLNTFLMVIASLAMWFIGLVLVLVVIICAIGYTKKLIYKILGIQRAEVTPEQFADAQRRTRDQLLGRRRR